jgi:uncharacterized protein (TIGR01777 family)
MLPPFKAGVGGPLGSGTQWMSWIHVDDLVALLLFALETPAAEGAVNATAPSPVTMNQFAKALGKAVHRPAIARVPGPVLKLLVGEMSTVLLDGQRVVPRKAESLGFRFRHPEVGEALRELLS